jgi:hypothetical protein
MKIPIFVVIIAAVFVFYWCSKSKPIAKAAAQNDHDILRAAGAQQPYEYMPEDGSYSQF